MATDFPGHVPVSWAGVLSPDELTRKDFWGGADETPAEDNGSSPKPESFSFKTGLLWTGVGLAVGLAASILRQ